MDNGFVLIHRKLLEWEWYSSINDTRLFIHCLLKANWKDGRFRGYEIPRGSFVTSVSSLVEETGLTTQQVKTSLNHLKSTNEITIKATTQFSIITINKYKDYQIDNKQDNKRATNEQQTSNNNRIKEINNNERNKKNNNKYIVEDNIKEIIDYLNLRVGSHYMYRTGSTRHKIEVRLEEGFTTDDFKEVIDKMCIEWKNTDMQKYLRPETLFGTKFESYLNREIKQTTKNIPLSSEEISSIFR